MSAPEQDAQLLLAEIERYRGKARGADRVRTAMRVGATPKYQRRRRIAFLRGVFGGGGGKEVWETVCALDADESAALYDALGIVQQEAKRTADQLAARLEVKP